MSKKRKTYDASELRSLQTRLTKHLDDLDVQIGCLHAAFNKSKGFDEAVPLRDAAQLIVTTCLTLSHFDTLISLAERVGPQTVPHLEDCGLTE